MKRLLIGFGAVFLLFFVTFFAQKGLNRAKMMKKHSRVDSYSDLVLSEFSNENKKPLGAVNFLSTDKSHGLVGFDPWGSPYEYFIEKAESKLTLIFLSKGKDDKAQTDLLSLKGKKNLKQKGDDFVYRKVISI